MHRTLILLYLAGLALCPLWYASATQLAWAGNAIGFGLLAALLSARTLAARAPPPMPLRRIGGVAALYLAVLAWTLCQASGAMPGALHHPSWSLAAAALEEPLQGAVSIDPEHTLLGAMRLATCAAVFWFALQVGRDERVACAIVLCALASAAGHSLYGLADIGLGWNHVLFVAKDSYATANYGAYVSAAFVNRSHYAAYCSLGLAAACGLVAREIARAWRAPGRSATRFIAIAARQPAARGVVAAALAIPVALGLWLSQSRSGVACAALGVATVVILHAMRARRRALAGGLSLALLGALALLAAQFAEPFVRRTLAQSDPLGGRLQVHAIVLRAIAERPWLGHGYDTFPQFFPLYRDVSVGYGGVWNAAHNSYLEVLGELGLPAAGALFAALGWLVWRCAAAALRRRRAALAPVVAVAASVAMGLHSAVDFPLQTQAVAITWAALLGAGVAQSWPSGELPAGVARDPPAASAAARAKAGYSHV